MPAAQADAPAATGKPDAPAATGKPDAPTATAKTDVPAVTGKAARRLAAQRLTRPDLADQLAAVPTLPGCYLYKDADGRVIYVGKAKDLRKRVASYFQDTPGGVMRHSTKTRRLVVELTTIETIALDSEVEALLVESQLIKELQPRFNILLKDGKDFPLLAISREEFPRVFITRDRNLQGVDLLGPFISSTDLRRAYHFLQRTFRFRTCDLDLHEADPNRRHFAPCLNWHIKRCSAPCTPKIGAAEYGADIRALRALVTGRNKSDVVRDLGTRMRAAAASLRFEDAARLRDQVQALDRLKERGRLRDYDEPAAPVIDLHSGLIALQEHLDLAAPPQVIEGIDNAHLQGTHVVAGLVRFIHGVPDKDGYRRFKIKGADGSGDPGNNDVAAMREVVGRRLRRLRDEAGRLPDILLVDGGQAQVATALEAARAEGVTPPCLIGLAKREETIIRSDGSELRLPRRDPGLRLLQCVRDEAHRFCRRYFHLLQKNAVHRVTDDEKGS